MLKIYFKGMGLLALLLLLVSSSFAQTIHNIPNTKPDTLANFIRTGTWAAGDTIKLTGAGVYQITATVDIPRSVHIKGDPALVNRPVIRFVGSSGSFRADANNTSVSFINVDFNGYQANNSTRTPYIFRGFANAVTDPAGGLATRFPKIMFKNSEAWGFQGGLILNNNSFRVVADELIIDNVVWHDMVGAYAIDLKQNAVKSLRVINSTFYNIATGFINNPYFSAASATPPRTEVIPQNIVIEDNTFYKVSGAGNNSFIQMNDPKDQSVTFTFRDNVVSMLHTAENARPFRIDPLAGNFNFVNNVFHSFTSTRDGGIHNLAVLDPSQTAQANITTSNIITTDPAFANAAVGNFRIPAGSPLLTAGANGGTIGDPSWTSGGTGFATHRISNAEENSLKTFIENTALWAPGDVIVLESPGMYVVREGIDIKQDVTIMGDPSLAQRPTITLYGGAFEPRANNLNILLKGFNVVGLTKNAQGADQRASILRFGGRGEGGEFSGGTFRIEDMDATGLSTGVELFYDNGLHYELLALNNVHWNDISGWVIDPRLNATDRIEVMNSTFSNFGGFLKNPYNVDAGKGRTTMYPMVIVIDHNTFYNGLSAVGGADAFIQINDPKEGQIMFTFTNNIVSTLINSKDTRPFRINAAAGTFVFRNNLFHNFESARDNGAHNLTAVDAAQTNVTVVNPVAGDPNFANPVARNFGLPTGSPLLTAGTDGGVIGDPTWATGEGLYTIHRITNAEDNSLKAFIENTALWSPGDVIMLVSPGNYKVDGHISIKQDLTVMGDPALATRPLVTFHTGGFQPMAEGLSMVFKGFDVNGKTQNAQGNDQQAMILEYGRNNAFGAKLIKFEDMHAYGLSNGVELYFNQGKIYDEIIINNVIWHDIANWIFNPRINAVKDVEITNSTFYDADGFMFNPYFSKDGRPEVIQQNILIDHNTFYRVGGGNKALLQVNDPTDASVNLTFTNNLVSNLRDVANARPFLLGATAGTFTFRDNVFYEYVTTNAANLIYNLEPISALANVTFTNIITTAPNFTNAAEGNFKLPNGSPLAVAGAGGTVIGDPQWAPDNITSTKPELAAAKIEVYPNPMRDVLHINAAAVVEVTLYNVSGSVVLRETINRTGSIKIAGIKPGLYIARITTGDQVQTVKLVKE